MQEQLTQPLPGGLYCFGSDLLHASNLPVKIDRWCPVSCAKAAKTMPKTGQNDHLFPSDVCAFWRLVQENWCRMVRSWYPQIFICIDLNECLDRNYCHFPPNKACPPLQLPSNSPQLAIHLHPNLQLLLPLNMHAKKALWAMECRLKLIFRAKRKS